MTVMGGGRKGGPVGVGVEDVRRALAAEDARCRAMLARAAPPEPMRAAAVAPARGPQMLVPDFEVTRGGMRRQVGAHWRALSPLALMVAQARLRWEARAGDAPFVPPFTPGQVAVAEDYAALVEDREGAGMRCASVEARPDGAGGGSGVFIDTFVQKGRWLAELRRRIGDGVAMSPVRHMDRGNGRRRITVRAAVDVVCLGGRDLSAVLVAFGWVADGKNRKALRAALCGALDRMQGYRDA